MEQHPVQVAIWQWKKEPSRATFLQSVRGSREPARVALTVLHTRL